MFDINSINNTVSASTLRDYAEQSFEQRGGGDPSIPDDRVEISEVAELLSRLAELPEGRARKIVQIRQAIQDGTYESDVKLEIATERLIREISQLFAKKAV